jgi:hypothetical protein
LAGLWALACMPSMLRGPPLFLTFLFLALCGVVAVCWWPAPPSIDEARP